VAYSEGQGREPETRRAVVDDVRRILEAMVWQCEWCDRQSAHDCFVTWTVFTRGGLCCCICHEDRATIGSDSFARSDHPGWADVEG